MVITSVSNRLYKSLKALKTKKARDAEGVFVVEGKSFVDDIPADYSVKRYAASQSFALSRGVSAYEKRAEATVFSDELFKKASDTVVPQGILAVCGQQTASLDDIAKDGALLLLCEQIADPGNIGALIRVAAAAGCGGVILAGQCADLYNPKTVRATAGALFRVRAARVADAGDAALFLKKRGFKTVAASVDAKLFHTDADLTGSCCVLIGNEAAGLSERARRFADMAVKIPMANGVESLNAAVAGGVLLYEAGRQRRKSP
jgi:TrmH family RNA methyltransferase